MGERVRSKRSQETDMSQELSSYVDELAELLRQDEGFSATMYQDTEQIWTIGYGYNLEEGISRAAAEFLLREKMIEGFQELDRHKPFWRVLPRPAKMVVGSMQYNLGWPRFSQFKKFWKALEAHDYLGAAEEMIDSRWYRQVKERGERLVSLMQSVAIQPTESVKMG